MNQNILMNHGTSTIIYFISLGLKAVLTIVKYFCLIFYILLYNLYILSFYFDLRQLHSSNDPTEVLTLVFDMLTMEIDAKLMVRAFKCLTYQT